MTLISLVNRVHFADGVLEPALAVEVEALGLARPLLITEPGLAAAGLADRVAAALGPRARPVIRDRAPENPCEADARALAAVWRDAGCDGFVALGGAAAIDLAKAAALAAVHAGPFARLAASAGGEARIDAPLPPRIAIPTEGGSGAEVSRVLTLTLDGGRRATLRGRRLIPDVAICDPAFGAGLGARREAEAALDAVAHCLEAFAAPGCHPPADAMALHGLARAAAALDPGHTADPAARRRTLMGAALCGGLAQDKGLGAAHAAANALAAGRGSALPHGALVAAVLPHALAFNAPALEARRADLAAALSLAPGEDPAGALTRLIGALGLATRLSALGVAGSALDRAAEAAAADDASGTNPRRAGAEDYRRLLDAAF